MDAIRFEFFSLPEAGKTPLSLQWRWRYDSPHDPLESGRSFAQFAQCVEDAALHGFDEGALPNGVEIADLIRDERLPARRSQTDAHRSTQGEHPLILDSPAQAGADLLL